MFIFIVKTMDGLSSHFVRASPFGRTMCVKNSRRASRFSLAFFAAPHSFSFVQLNHSTVATVHIFYYIFSTRLLAMTERRALRYRNLLIDTENELLNLYSNDGLRV
jgi:hypothetical protein